MALQTESDNTVHWNVLISSALIQNTCTELLSVDQFHVPCTLLRAPEAVPRYTNRNKIQGVYKDLNSFLWNGLITCYNCLSENMKQITISFDLVFLITIHMFLQERKN